MKRLLGSAVFAGIAAGLFAADVEIVVVASRIPEESRTTPAVVRVIPEEEIERSDTVLDALSDVPGVSVVRSSSGDAYVTMGGFGENGFMRTLVLRDGVPLNNPDLDSISWGSIALSRVSRIEILQGPASAQYGDQAVAGVINIITADPEPGVSVEAATAVDSNGSNEQALALSWGAAGDEESETAAEVTPRFGIAADAVRRATTPERARSDASMWSTSLTATGAVGWFSGRIRGYYTPSAYELPGALSEEEFDDDPDQVGRDFLGNPIEDDEISQLEYGISAEPRVATERLDLSVPLSVAVTDARSDFTSLSSFSDSTLRSVDASIVASYLLFLGDVVALTPNVGLDYRRSALEVTRYAAADRETATFEGLLTRDAIAPFVGLEGSVADRVIVETGLRYEIARLSGSSEDDRIDGRDTHLPIAADAGLTYLPAETVKLSARYGRTFRYPALDEQVSYFGFGTDEFYADLDPERGHSVVLGAAYTGDAFEVSASPFLILMADEIVYDNAEMRNFNRGRTRRYGATLDAGYTVGRWSIGAGYDYTRAELANGEHEGNLVPLVPAHTVRIDSRVELPLGFGLESDMRRSSGYYEGGDEANELDLIPGRTAWNARLDWASGFGLSAYLSARNILDDRTPTRVYFGGWYPMPGRSFEIGAQWDY